jgi:mannose-6-phosphate isomerase-like protein (cupin superfamily)
MNEHDVGVIVVRPEHGESVQIGSFHITIKLSGSETDGACTLVETVYPKGGQIQKLGLHDTASVLCFTDGRFELSYADRTEVATVGTVVYVAAGTPLGIRNLASVSGRLLRFFHPAGVEGALREMRRLLTQRGPGQAEGLNRMLESYGFTRQ